MTKEQEQLYELYMKLSKEDLAKTLAIINSIRRDNTIVPMQPGLYPPYPPYECPPDYKPIEVWYTNNTGNPPREYNSNIS